MDRIVVTIENFDAMKAIVLSGSANFYVPTCTKCTRITGRNIKTWEDSGIRLLWPVKDGFRMASGRSSVFILPGYLVVA